LKKIKASPNKPTRRQQNLYLPIAIVKATPSPIKLLQIKNPLRNNEEGFIILKERAF
jgi:hypothetical protein